jgi:uncharacterized protein (DUF2062 family)
MSQTLWRRKVVRPVVDLLRQGLTPEKLAFTIALGIALGVTPVLGSTMLLCSLAAFAFRLNLAAIQLVNWLVYPFQLALLIPFYRIGGWAFRTAPSQRSGQSPSTPLLRGSCWQASPLGCSTFCWSPCFAECAIGSVPRRGSDHADFDPDGCAGRPQRDVPDSLSPATAPHTRSLADGNLRVKPQLNWAGVCCM